MPAIRVHLFRESDGTVPLLEWLDGLKPPKVVAKCRVLIELLKAAGQDLAVPTRTCCGTRSTNCERSVGRVQYRMLYFFHGQGTAIISHGFIKRGAAVDPKEIDRAIDRKERFRANSEQHTHQES